MFKSSQDGHLSEHYQMTEAAKFAAYLSAFVFSATYQIHQSAKIPAPKILEKISGLSNITPAMIVR